MALPRSLVGWALLPLLLSLPAAHADILDTVPVSHECGRVLLDMYGAFAWPGQYYSSTSATKALCREPNAVVSLYAAAYTYCSHRLDATLDLMNSTCLADAHTAMVPASDFAANLTPAAIAALPIYSEADAEEAEEAASESSESSEGSGGSGGRVHGKRAGKRRKETILPNMTHAVLVNADTFALELRTEHLRDQSGRLEMSYTFAQYGFWAIVLFFGIVQNVAHHVVAWRRGSVDADAVAEGDAGGGRGSVLAGGVVGRVTAVVRKYVLTPAALAPLSRRRRVFGCSVPTRAAGFVVLAYWAVCIALGAAHIDGFPGNTSLSSVRAQVCRYLARRAGIMSYANLPLLWLFAGRNNAFLWLTGWSFATFNTFHRHVARIATVQALVHSVGYPLYYDAAGQNGKYKHKLAMFFMHAGVAAMALMGFLVVASVSALRRRLYESFLLLHIVAALLVLVFLYYHTANHRLSMYNYPFIIPACGLWALDRLARLVRQAYINLHIRRAALRTTAATVVYDAAAHMLTVDAVPANHRLAPRPGQHYYLYQPLRFFGWENHPFTLAHWTRSDNDDHLHLHFCIRPCDGWTRTLMKQCLAAPASPHDGTHTITARLLLEGPYGAPQPLHTFEDVLLVAGGAGITAVLPYLMDYARRRASTTSDHRIPTRTRHITLVWADPRAAHLQAVATRYLAALGVRSDIDIVLYDTSAASVSPTLVPPPSPPSSDNKTSALDEKTAVVQDTRLIDSTSDSDGRIDGPRPAKDAAFALCAGRPDVPVIVRDRAQVVQGTSARLAVMVCGPEALTDAVRYEVADCMTTERDAIVYFEEAFEW